MAAPSRNLITDIPGIRVGHADDARLGSGVTAVVFDAPAVAAIDVRGGGPGTRESALLDPAMTVERIDAIALAGGSAFGLDAASGIQAWLAEQGRGFAIRSARVPIVPAAILFDLLNGGDKAWGRFPPYRELGYAAADAAAAAATGEVWLGSVGAGLGATTANLKGGDGPWFWAAPFERDREFGGRGFPQKLPADALAFRTKGSLGESTTLAVVATDAKLTKTQARRLAIMAQDG